MSKYLECGCGSGLFRDIWRLRLLGTGGIAPEIAGKTCEKCGKIVDTADLVKLRDEKDRAKEKEQEVSRLAKEVAQKAVQDSGTTVEPRTRAPLPNEVARTDRVPDLRK